LPNDPSKQRLLEEQAMLQPPKVHPAHGSSISEHAAPVIAPESDDGHMFLLISVTSLAIFLLCTFLCICICFAVVLQGAMMLRTHE
jgi:hypothetical protein